MVGGGKDAFIGAVHRIAARIDDDYELVAGALSSTPEKARASGAALGLAEDRTYDDFATMAKREARRKNGIEAVAIVTPNHMHAPAAREFLKRGIHVICDKPLTATLAEAKRLAEGGRGFGRALHPDAQLHRLPDDPAGAGDGRGRAARQDPRGAGRSTPRTGWRRRWSSRARSRPAGAPTRRSPAPAAPPATSAPTPSTSRASSPGSGSSRWRRTCRHFVPGRRLDDNGNVLLRYEGGARGMLWCSQVATGNENALRLRVYGEKGGLEWEQEEPNYLWFTPLGEPKRLLTRGGAGAGADAARVSRTPGGHPEGYLEGFANIYAEAARAIRARREQQAGAEGGGLPDDRGRRRGRRLRRGLRASSAQERRLGHAVTRLRRAPVAGVRRECERHQLRARPAQVGRRVRAGARSASPPARSRRASRSALKCESAGTSARVSTAGKVQTTDTSVPISRPSPPRSV